jgi:hypothetical protein
MVSVTAWDPVRLMMDAMVCPSLVAATPKWLRRYSAEKTTENATPGWLRAHPSENRVH